MKDIYFFASTLYCLAKENALCNKMDTQWILYPLRGNLTSDELNGHFKVQWKYASF